jgi:hypothetical protein
MQDFMKSVFAAMAPPIAAIEAIEDIVPALRFLDADDPRAKLIEQAAGSFPASAAPPA